MDILVMENLYRNIAPLVVILFLKSHYSDFIDLFNLVFMPSRLKYDSD